MLLFVNVIPGLVYLTELGNYKIGKEILIIQYNFNFKIFLYLYN